MTGAAGAPLAAGGHSPGSGRAASRSAAHAARALSAAPVSVVAMDEGVRADGLTPEEGYTELCDGFAGRAGISVPEGGRGFGRDALRSHGRIFAMLVRGRMVVKLPADRVEELVAEGRGVRFDANKGTPMREWLSLDPGQDALWSPLAEEALAYAESAGR